MSKAPIRTPAEPLPSDAPSVCVFSGSANADFSDVLTEQAAQSLWLPAEETEVDKKIGAAFAGMQGLRPLDEVEGMLAAQMVAAHNAAMECFRRAMIPQQHPESRNNNLNHASKLTRAYAAMLEALGKYRGKGQQHVIVEHVHVHSGGQAIVGNISQPVGGGGDQKNK